GVARRPITRRRSPRAAGTGPRPLRRRPAVVHDARAPLPRAGHRPGGTRASAGGGGRVGRRHRAARDRVARAGRRGQLKAFETPGTVTGWTAVRTARNV